MFTTTADNLWNNQHRSCPKIFKQYHKGEQNFKSKLFQPITADFITATRLSDD